MPKINVKTIQCTVSQQQNIKTKLKVAHILTVTVSIEYDEANIVNHQHHHHVAFEQAFYKIH